MGYNMIFNRQFIKVDEKRFIPYVNSKSSNCTMFNSNGREVRAEEPFPAVIGRFEHGSGRNYTTLEAIEKYLDFEIAARVEKGNFNGEKLTIDEVAGNIGWWITFYFNSNRNASKSQILNWYKNGFKDAMTVEEIVSGLGTITARNYQTNEYINIETTEDLIKFIDSEDEIHYQINFGSYEYVRKNQLRKKNENRSKTVGKTKVYGKRGYVVTFEEDEKLYIQQRKRKRYYTNSIEDTKIFKSEKAALRHLKYLKIYGTKVVEKVFEKEVLLHT